MPEPAEAPSRSLAQMALAYLQAGGYVLIAGADSAFAVEKDGRRVLVWASDDALASSDDLGPAEREVRDRREAALLKEFADEMQASGAFAGYYLVPRRVGLSQRFVTEATRLLGDGGVRVPIEFFDAAYKADAPGAGAAKRSVLGDLLRDAARIRRVAQPFFRRTGLADEDRVPGDGDLVEVLETTLTDPPDRPSLRIIDGGAGIGKSVAFAEIARRLVEEFRAAKQQRSVSRLRPIVFLPEHLRVWRESDEEPGEVAPSALQSDVRRAEDLVEAIINTDLASLVTPEQLGWLLQNGFAVWMFDGLDEVYSGESGFFEHLARILDAPGSRAQILLCSRDSLLTSSGPLRDFLDARLRAGSGVEIYELAPWGREAWTRIAAMELEQDRPGAAQMPRVQAFVGALERSPDVAALASLPFYCSVLLRHFDKHGALVTTTVRGGGGIDEFDLIETVALEMLEREHGKGLFDWSDFAEAGSEVEDGEGDIVGTVRSLWSRLSQAEARELMGAVEAGGREALLEMLGAIAHLHTRSTDPDGSGQIGTQTIATMFDRSYGIATVESAHTRHLVTALVQFAFFGPGRRGGEVGFAHPIMAEYLASRYAVTLVRDRIGKPGRFGGSDAGSVLGHAVGDRPMAPGALFERYFRREMAHDGRLADYVMEAHRTASFDRPAAEALVSRLAQQPGG